MSHNEYEEERHDPDGFVLLFFLFAFVLLSVVLGAAKHFTKENRGWAA